MPDDIQPTDDESAKNDDETKEEIERQQDELSDEAKQSSVRLTASADALQEKLDDFVNVAELNAAQMPDNGALNPREVVIDVGPSNAELMDRLNEVHQLLLATRAEPTVLNNLKVRYMFAAFGVVGALSAFLSLYYNIQKTAGNKTLLVAEPLSSLGDELFDPVVNDADSQALLATWLVSDPEFWERLAQYVEKNAPRSFQEQLVMAQLTMDLAKYSMVGLWSWSAEEKLGLAHTVATEISSGGLASAYRILPTVQSGSKLLPRAVAASVMSVALVIWKSKIASEDNVQ
jgi:hypothetical protein